MMELAVNNPNLSVILVLSQSTTMSCGDGGGGGCSG